jgi:selenocysteine-specific elongation factor
MVILLDKKILEPGEEGLVQFQLDKPIVAGPRDKYIVRSFSPSVTIGGGMIIGELRARLKRLKPWIIENILKEEKATGNPRDFVEYALETTLQPWLAHSDLLKKTKLPLKKIGEVMDILLREGKAVSFARGNKFAHQLNFASGRQKLLDFLTQYHLDNPLETGITRIETMRLLQFDTDLFNEVLSVLLNENTIVDEKHKLRLKEHRVNLNNEENQLKGRLAELYLNAGFSTPRQDELPAKLSAPENKVNKLVNLLFDEGTLVRLPQDVIMHKNRVGEAKEIIIGSIRGKGELDSAFFKSMIKSTRKYALALLDYFDEQGLTVRTKNIRKLKITP